jgi:hypothetical protein
MLKQNISSLESNQSWHTVGPPLAIVTDPVALSVKPERISKLPGK